MCTRSSTTCTLLKHLLEIERYMAHLCAGPGHAERHAGLRGEGTGLMASLRRKKRGASAAHLAPTATRSRQQLLLHFTANSVRSDGAMLRRVAKWLPVMDVGDGGWWIFDAGVSRPTTRSARGLTRLSGPLEAEDTRSWCQHMPEKPQQGDLAYRCDEPAMDCRQDLRVHHVDTVHALDAKPAEVSAQAVDGARNASHCLKTFRTNPI